MIDIKLFRTSNKLTQDELANYLHTGKAFISQIENGRSSLPPRMYSEILNNSKGWDVSMLIDDNQELEDAQPTMPEQNQMGLVPLLPIAAQGGSLNDFVESVEISKCEKMLCPVSGVDFAITVKGESMNPEYPNGSIIFIKRINERAFIEWGKVYVLDTCNGTVVKEIRKGEAGDSVTCHSTNPDPKYQPFDVKYDDMYGMYRVVMCMSMK